MGPRVLVDAPVLRQTLAAIVLKIGVSALGAAIDNGTFDARGDSMLGQDSFWSDERGAEEAMAIIDNALKSLLKVRDNAKARLAEADDEGFLISYLLAGYEGSLRPV